MTEFTVHLELHVDEARDDAEWWPHIIGFAMDRGRRPMPLMTGATDTAMAAWDLIEHIHGQPAPHKAYRVTITPIERDVAPW